MLDQFIIGNKRSYDDYEASVSERTITDGKKKTIKDDVPYSNKVYDFSKIDGELYWEESTIRYIVEITADTPEQLSEKIIAFKSWVKNVFEEVLHDPYIPNYHFLATFSDISVDDSEIEKATITVVFTAYPYMIANEAKVFNYSLTAGAEKTVSIVNNSSHKVTPTLVSTSALTVKRGADTFNIPKGEITDEYFTLDVGTNSLILKSTEDATVSITFYEEVF